jgi:hypothetical protein
LVRQRTQIINDLRGHLAEFGVVGAKGRENAMKLISIVDKAEANLPADARPVLALLIEQLRRLEVQAYFRLPGPARMLCFSGKRMRAITTTSMAWVALRLAVHRKRRSVSGPAGRKRGSTRNVDTARNQQDGDPVTRRWPFAEERDGHECRHGRG